MKQPEPKSLTRQQLAEFLVASRGEPLEPLIKFMAHTGVRLGEALALHWVDVDLEGKVAIIRRSVRTREESQPKMKFGLRPVDLPNAVRETLAVLPSRDTSILVFPYSRGGYVRARLVHHVFARIAKRARLPPVHAHMLQHTWATMMLNMGAPLHYVSRALGHHSTAFTASFYGDRPDASANATPPDQPSVGQAPDGVQKEHLDGLRLSVAATPALAGLDLKGGRPAVSGELRDISEPRFREDEADKPEDVRS